MLYCPHGHELAERPRRWNLYAPFQQHISRDQSNILQGSVSTTSSGERESISSFKLSSALSNLTMHSAEVNIGIIAASLPTLLPLYRLVHDKIPSTTGRFYIDNGNFLFGQRPNADNSLQQATQTPRTEAEAVLPQNSQRVNSAHEIFSIFEEEEDKDIEMQASFSGRPSHFQYT